MGEINIQLFYEQNNLNNGPGKLVNNLIKGLTRLNINTKLNDVPLPNYKKIFLQCHSLMSNIDLRDCIIGPNICVLPIDNKIVMDMKYKTIIVPSLWVYNKYRMWLPENKIKIWSVGVDTELFYESGLGHKEYDCLIYFKRRDESDLKIIEDFLVEKNQTYNIISYGRYSENEFIDLIHKSRYGIVIDDTESQGIAIQEMMSCNLPLLVWDVRFWNYRGDEYKVDATSIPYWDSNCGEYFFDIEELNNTFNIFNENINSYNPRKFVMENLSLDISTNKLLDIINI